MVGVNGILPDRFALPERMGTDSPLASRLAVGVVALATSIPDLHYTKFEEMLDLRLCSTYPVRQGQPVRPDQPGLIGMLSELL